MNVDFQALVDEENKTTFRAPVKKLRATPWVFLLLGTFSLAVTAYCCDHWSGNADNLLFNIAYVNVAGVFLILETLGFALYLMFVSRFELSQNIALSILSCLFFLLIIEGVGHLVLGLELVKSTQFVFRRFYIPTSISKYRPFPAGDIHPVTGRSHLPNESDAFINCEGDSLHWYYNSVGANDRERSVIKPEPGKKRIAVIGDSFMEGYLVNEPNRCSSILERKTGLEHLNFAVNGSNPVHYYLMYKSVARAFEPDIVMIGFLPANDFEVLNERQAYTHVDWPMYIPYWQGTYPNYKLRYSLANVKQSISHGNHTSGSLLKVVDSVYATLSIGDKLKADLLTHSSLFRLLAEGHLNSYKKGVYTKFEQFTEEEWQYVRHSLTQLIREAAGKKVLIVSLPTLPDLLALEQGKQNRIDPLLASFCREQKINFIPLAPAFLAKKESLPSLYMDCDGHWSKRGEAFAANVLLQHPTYRSLIGLL